MEDNNKDDNNDKGMLALGLDRDMGFLGGPSYGMGMTRRRTMTRTRTTTRTTTMTSVSQSGTR